MAKLPDFVEQCGLRDFEGLILGRMVKEKTQIVTNQILSPFKTMLSLNTWLFGIFDCSFSCLYLEVPTGTSSVRNI